MTMPGLKFAVMGAGFWSLYQIPAWFEVGGAMMILLDPAAPYGRELPERTDITYFVCYPCHSHTVNDEIDPEARKDFFGAIKARLAARPDDQCLAHFSKVRD
jgi:hypothetical protein